MNPSSGLPLLQQSILVLAALTLFLSFVLLAQARLVSAIHAFAWQGVLLAGVTAVVQPGGSVRDDVVIQAADEYGMVMAMSKLRLFHH